MSWKWLRLALATALIVLAMAGVGLYNTCRWFSALPASISRSELPLSVYLGAAFLLLQVAASLLILLGASFGSAVSGRRRVVAALLVLLVVHVARWAEQLMHTSALNTGADLTRLVVALWLAVLVYKLGPNNSSKPTPLRGAA